MGNRSHWKSWILQPNSHTNPNGLVNTSCPDKGWKPITLRSPVLATFILLSLSLVAILELLSNKAGLSTNLLGSNAIYYADQEGNISFGASFAYLYLPTIIAVFYSMIWSWIDLDAKRLEPWFQLSLPHGASAQNSLLLQYPAEFLAFVPFTAVRRRHWSVFIAGTTMMVIFWIITPLQSAIFGTRVATRSLPVDMVTTSSLLPPEQQIAALTTSFLSTAYAISWLNQQLPPFSTVAQAIVPFAPVGNLQNPSSTETWTSMAPALQTNITCINADIIAQKSLQYTFDDHQGCRVSDVALPDARSTNSTYMLLYVGYFDNAENDYALQNPNCTIENSHKFLAIWGNAASQTGIGMYGNITALFCTTHYHSQEVVVSVNATDHSILSTNFLADGAAEDLTEETFNITNFEYLIGTGITQVPLLLDYQKTTIIEQFPRLIEYGVAWPTTNMVGFAVANTQSIDYLSNPEILQSAFLKAHQLLFAVAVNALLTPVSFNSSNVRQGTRIDQPNSVILVRIFCIATEIYLALVAFMTASLWYLSHARPSKLSSDPASIGTVMSLVADCKWLDNIFANNTAPTREEIDQLLHWKRFRLVRDVSSPKAMVLEPTSDISPLDSILAKERRLKSTNPTAFRPFEMRTSTGLAFIALLSGSVAGLIYLRTIIMDRNGLILPSDNSLVRQVLENYMPTILATFLEPFWVLLNRLLCILRPLEELRHGQARRSKSIDIQYDSMPPQLVFWRAIKAHHFLLASVCAVALLSNVLAVSLSSLLNESLKIKTSTTLSSPKHDPVFNGSSITNFIPVITYSDHFYVALANLTSGTTLPPWIGKENYFLPFDIPLSIENQGKLYTANTEGFGADFSCQEITNSSTTDQLNFRINEHDIQFSTVHTISPRTSINCVSYLLLNGDDQSTIFEMPPDSGANALELITSMSTARVQPNNMTVASGICESILIAGWVQLKPSTSNITSRSSTQTFLACTPNLRAANFTITVDSAGHILSSRQISSFTAPTFAETPSFNGLLQAHPISSPPQALLAQAAVLINAAGRSRKWHNTSTTSDWINTLLSLSLPNDASLVSPTNTIPQASVIAPVLSQIYTQLFAILLGLNSHVFAAATSNSVDNSSAVIVTISEPETRILMSDPMFFVSLAILSINLIVAVIFYYARPKAFLPLMPSSIAAVLGMLAGSRALREAKESKGEREASRNWNQSQDFGPENQQGLRRRKTGADDGEERFGYGRFIGTDGMARVGIEWARFIVPLESRNPDAEKMRWWWRWWKRRDGRAGGGTWI